MTWEDDLTREQRADWDRFVAYQREHTVKMMMDSAMVISLMPDEEVDVKYAVELQKVS